MIRDGSTTISLLEGRFASLYDNTSVRADTPLAITSFGVLELSRELLRITRDEVRDCMSNRIPMWMRIDTGGGIARCDPRTPTPPIPIGDLLKVGHAVTAVTVIGNRSSSIYHLLG